MSISLIKGQKISLQKEAGAGLKRVMMGLGWDARKPTGLAKMFAREKEIDLDASCVLFDKNKKMIDAVWFRQLRSNDGSIVHQGDNRTGAGEGDDEQIIVDLNRLPASVQTLVFVVSSFTDVSFDQIENAFCRLVNCANNQQIAKFDLSCQGPHTAQIMAKVYRHDNEWKMHAIGENSQGRTFKNLLPAITPYL